MIGPEPKENVESKSLEFIGDHEITLEINDFDREIECKEILRKKFKHEDAEDRVFYEIESADLINPSLS